MHMQSATLRGAQDGLHASHAHADAIFWNEGLHRIALAQARLVFSSVLFPKKTLSKQSVYGTVANTHIQHRTCR